ncbi:MAG TPA: hypothetical protein VIL16_19055 [Trebonia sp.]
MNSSPDGIHGKVRSSVRSVASSSRAQAGAGAPMTCAQRAAGEHGQRDGEDGPAKRHHATAKPGRRPVRGNVARKVVASHVVSVPPGPSGVPGPYDRFVPVIAASVTRAVRAAALVMAAAAVAAACGSGQPQAGPAASASIPRSLLSEARPIGTGPRFTRPADGPVAGSCRRSLGSRVGVHVEVFAANRVLLLPAGIGARRPWTTLDGRITGARCYGAAVTLDPTGLVLVRPGSRLTVADLFRSWGEPLSGTRLTSFEAPAGAQVAVFVDGRPWNAGPASVPLARHAEIVLEVGPHVPPHSSYAFPPGT